MHCLRCKQEIESTFRACPHCGDPITDFVRKFTDELLDGKYRILERLGAGGMGEVFKAEHTYLGAIRVIKVIRTQISDSREAHDRFLREARVATKVQHTNVATLHDFSALPDGSHYMVWEYIDGENLAQRLRSRGPLSPRAAVRLILQALHGLEAIHRAGIVHRDISPENLMIARETDTLKIIDLGVAKIDDPSEVSATRTGIFVGKLRYASPEQLGFIEEGEKIDGRTDLYAIGMVLYETLAGRPPFEATSPHQYYMMHSEERELKPLELPADLPGGAELQQALRRALQRDRTRRFQSAREFAEALEAVERSLPDPGAMKTMALPLDGEATMRTTPLPASDTLHRETVRTEQKTVLTSSPDRLPPVAPQTPPPLRSKAPFLAIAIVLLALLGVAAWWFTRDGEEPVADAPPVTTATATVTTPPSQTTLEVVTQTTETAPALVAPVTTTSTTAAPLPPVRAAAVTPEPKPVLTQTEQTPPPVTTTTETPEPEPATPAIPAGTFVEHGDEATNEALLARMQQELTGTSRVVVRGGAMQAELENALREEFPSLEIVSSAPVVIDFDGLIEQKGRGRKTRYASATIRKNGRVVFRYLLPTEIYRVGNTPVEAFVNKLEDVFSE
ncbi:MAG TPA: serine/threonine-protein kinase [Thermoanaerobaculia bacterium]|nr:serine/threonine-protein kinase [Thermoanaerobaculia bacterium]